MKLDKLARQIRRDISASPKKAAALGVMVLVAAYFWAPMIWGWLAPGGAAPTKAVASGDVILEDELPVATTTPGQLKQLFPWEKVRRQMLADVRMKPVEFDRQWLDPFRPAPRAAEDPSQPATATAQAIEAPAFDPAAIGLTLSSIAIGPRRRTATINGETYREGELVIVGKGEEGKGEIVFRLAKIDSRGVALEREGKSFELKLQRPKLAQGDELTSRPRPEL